jgi:homocysteine S-methyltransferase
VILDGGLGLELARRGFTYTTALWSGEVLLARPGLLLDVHRAFVAAGAEIIETATYQLSHAALRALGYDAAAIDALFARAVAIAREAVARERLPGKPPALVAASLGPHGATLGDGSEYSAVQHLDAAGLYAFHAERTRSVVRAHPDIVLFETIPTRGEALIAARVARDLNVPRVWLSLSCADDTRTYGGDDVASIVRELDAFPGIETIGVNCTPPAAVAALVRAIRAETTKPLVICPNLGQHWETTAAALAGGTPESDLLRRLPEWLDLGVAHIGGCCGVGPETIAAIAATMLTRREGQSVP